MSLPSNRVGVSRRSGLESLETRDLLSASPIMLASTPTPAAAIAELTKQQALIGVQTVQLAATLTASQNDLLYLTRQLSSDNFRQLSLDTQTGNTQAAIADLNQRTVINAAGVRITGEVTTSIGGLTAANQVFRTETAALIAGVKNGSIAPNVAIAAQLLDIDGYNATANVITVAARQQNLLELANLTQLTYLVEGVKGQTNLGTFHGGFDIKGPTIPAGLLHDYLGSVTTQFTRSGSLLQGTFTGSTSDYLEAQSVPSTGTPTIVRAPIIGGTLTATVVPGSDALGFAVHGTVHMSFGAVGNIPAHSQDFQIRANLTANQFLVGDILINGQKVGSFDWGRM